MSSLPNVRPHLMATVLRELRQRSMTSIELQEATRISEPTARRVLKELQQMNLVTVAGKRESTGGRRPRTYWLNGEAKVVIGVHLELPSIHFLVCDLAGNVIRTDHISGDFDLFPNEALHEIADFVQQIKADVSEQRLLGLGVASPGYLDPSGVILSIGRDPGWQNVPIGSRLEQEIGLHVLVENDVDSMAQAEIEWDQSLAETDFVYLGFMEGVKASLALNGAFYSGPLGNAGNIGHTTVDPQGPLCRCGNRGCLEALASVRAICAAFERQFEQGKTHHERLKEIAGIPDHGEKFEAILGAAETGEPLCGEIVSEALRFFGLAVANLVNLFQVRLIIVGGALSNMPPGLWILLDDEVRRRLPPLLRNNLTMRRGQDNRACNAAFGVANRFVEHYLTSVFEQELVEIQT